MSKTNLKVVTESFVRSEIAIVRQDLKDAVDAILQGMDNMFKNVATKEDLKKLATKEDLNELKNEVSYIKDDIKGLTADLSDTPSRKEFNRLEDKVDKHIHSHN